MHRRKWGVLMGSLLFVTLSVFAIRQYATATAAPGETALNTPAAVVTVDTVSLTVDGDTASIAALLADPGNDGLISFPEALFAVNSTGAGNTINFNLAPGSAIDYSNTYYLYADNTTIDGDVNGDGTPDIALDGYDANWHGLVIRSSNNVLRGLLITGLSLDGTAHNNLLVNNYIGLAFDGINPYPGKQVNGIEIEYGASGNIIGGTTPADRNWISGNQFASGILIHSGAHDNEIIGNYVGVGINDQASPNWVGIFVSDGAYNNIVGGDRSGTACDGPCNVISGNGAVGVVVSDPGSIDNEVKGNYVGVNPAGTGALPNAGSGIQLQSGVTDTLVGGERTSQNCAGPCNVVSGNGGGGLNIISTGTMSNTVQGNFVGMDAQGTTPIPNTLSGIFLNYSASANTIGGDREIVSSSCEGFCNLIGGNGEAGVVIGLAGTDDNKVLGNFIGVGLDGVSDIGNGLGGVVILNSFSTRSSQRAMPTGTPATYLVAREMTPDGIETGAFSDLRLISQRTIPPAKAPGGTAPTGNLIGGARNGITAACNGPCNMIGGNGGDGIFIYGPGTEMNVVQGNYIGHELNSNGQTAVPNDAAGVTIAGGAAQNEIGGDDLDCRDTCNVISGNADNGVWIDGTGTMSNTVTGNYIGLSASGNFTMPNGLNGVEISNAATNNTIGGTRTNTFCIGPCNLIGGNLQAGVVVQGSGTTGNEIRGNRIGYEDGVNVAPDGNWGVIVAYDANQTTIGGQTEEDGNEIYKGISVISATQVTMLYNEIEMPAADATGGDVPMDLGDDGPTCNPWTGGGGANSGIAPPRILNLNTSLVEGETQPGYTVEVFEVTAVGTDRGRYFARSVRPIGQTTADANGHFSFSVPLSTLSGGDQVAVTATDGSGNTSELSQLMRPVIFVHGIGGSWLEGANGDNLWLPPPGDTVTNDNLARLALNPDGSEIENVSVDGLIEFGGWAIYGPVVDAFRNNGYNDAGLPLFRYCHYEPALFQTDTDIYRFCYDWRLGLSATATALQQLVGSITSPGNTSVAASCEADIVAHSMGGMVASLYLHQDRTHARDHVHRFLTMGTPYLGTPQAAAAHTKGHIFDLDSTYFWVEFDWGRMLQMAQNLTTAYTLLPGVNYAAASNQSFYLHDLYGNPLPGYGATRLFMTSPKIVTNPYGLARNGGLWAQEQNQVHDRIDDWTSWSSEPPHIFRIVGNIDDSTAVEWDWSLWTFVKRFLNPLATGLRSEPGDTLRHVYYRSTQYPKLGPGDGTVALPSATLGRGVGTDYSGVVGNVWIEDFEPFPHEHLKLVTENDSLNRMIEILESGYIANWPSRTPERAPAVDTSEDFYIFGTAPLAVHVHDSLGNHTGPMTPTHYSEIEYEVPGISYMANDLAVVLSLDQASTYTLTLQAPVTDTTFHFVRQSPTGTGIDSNALYPDYTVAVSGSLRLVLSSGGITVTAPFAVDADGDGAYEGSLSPAEIYDSNLPGPPIPEPYPWLLQATARITATHNQTATLTLPNSGGAAWQWQVAAGAAWITPTMSSGQTPQTISVTLGSLGLPLGKYTSTITVTLGFGGYQTEFPLPVLLEVKPQAPAAPALAIAQGGTDILLTWASDARNSSYEVYRSSTPFFSTTGMTPTAVLTAGSASYTDLGAAVDGNNYFYIVLGLNSIGEAASSPQVGKFSFAVQPGN